MMAMNHVMSVVWFDCDDPILSFGSMPPVSRILKTFDPDFLRLLRDDWQ